MKKTVEPYHPKVRVDFAGTAPFARKYGDEAAMQAQQKFEEPSWKKTATAPCDTTHAATLPAVLPPPAVTSNPLLCATDPPDDEVMHSNLLFLVCGIAVGATAVCLLWTVMAK